jgi:glycosyltransferase involved in cell wall biosynthesis
LSGLFDLRSVDRQLVSVRRPSAPEACQAHCTILRMEIVHVISSFRKAGPARSLLAYERALWEMGDRSSSTLVVLTPSVHPEMLLSAKRNGFRVVIQPGKEVLEELLSRADIVHLHYWNCPAATEFLHGTMPPCRLAIWYRVHGANAPQCITPFQLQRADAVLVTSTASLELPVFDRFPADRVFFAPGIADRPGMRRWFPKPHRHFNVTYLGTVAPTKMHPRFVEMSRSIDVPDLRIVVCGAYDDHFREHVGDLPGFELRGFVDDVGEILATSDVFGYPLCPETYATSEQSIQEAMWAGVPPVVFPYGGLAKLVEHGETGLVVHSEMEYVAAVEYLFAYPKVRRRLGNNARDHAVSNFDLKSHAARLLEVREAICRLPKTRKTSTSDSPLVRFHASLDAATSSLLAESAGKWRDQHADGVFSDFLAHGEGGIIHYRNSYPGIPEFRLWTALALRTTNAQVAAAELEAAVAAGLEPVGTHTGPSTGNVETRKSRSATE